MRHRATSGRAGKGEQRGSESSKLVFWGLLLVFGFAILTPNGSVAGVYALVFSVLGLLLIAFPPRFRIPPWLLVLAAGLVVTSALPLLPRNFAGAQDWRLAVEGLGLDTRDQITPHPQQTRLYLIGFAAIVLFAVSLAGHRLSLGGQYAIALGFTLMTGAYALLAMLAQDFGWSILWDSEPSFGLFPNRNHSASLMAMGGICALGVLFHSLRSQRWIGALLSGASLGILVWALLGYSSSRAGVLLLGLGFGAWLLGLGRRYLSARVVISIGVLGGLAVLLFYASDAKVKKRIQETVSTEEEGQRVIGDDTPLDFRVLVYQDAAEMISSEPWTGVGLGVFKFVFPQYREASATNGLCVHPESDYLMVAAENGWLSLVLLGSLVISCFLLAFRRNWGKRSWPLRLACLLAACVVPLHGIFDVPGHRIGLALGSVLLLTINWRPSRRQRMGSIGAIGFRLGGALMLLGGVSLAHAEWQRDGHTPINDADISAETILRLHAEDQALLAIPDGEDSLEMALEVAEAAIRTTPLDPELHYLRGAMALNFEGLEELTLQSFAIQRLLDPSWVAVPLRQASGWKTIDPVRTAMLWGEAMRRAERLAALQASLASQPAATWSRILQQAKGDEALLEAALPIAGNDARRLRSWIALGSDDLRARLLPGLLDWVGLDPPTRIECFRAWHRAGNRADAQAYADSHPDLGEIKW
ncbi:MAG: O-antigen ligase family protein [Verrucomicrobiales bacterium]